MVSRMRPSISKLNFAFLFLCFQLLQAQHHHAIDSLRSALANAENKEQAASLHLKLFNSFKRIHSDSAKLHIKNALQFVNGKLSDSLTAKTRLAQIEQNLIGNNYDSVFHYTENIIPLLKQLTAKEQVDLYSMVGTAHYYKSDYAKAIIAHRKAEKISDTNHLEAGQARVLYNIGIQYIKM